MGAIVIGLLIHTGSTAAGLFQLKRVAKKIAKIIWRPTVGVKAIKVPRANPPAMAFGELLSFMSHRNAGRRRSKNCTDVFGNNDLALRVFYESFLLYGSFLVYHKEE